MTGGAHLATSPSRNVQAINLALRTGNLPRAGGFNDQDDDFVEELEFVIAELQKHESRKAKAWSKTMSGSK